MKKIILWGLAAGFLMLIIGMGVGQIFYLIDPDLKGMYENTNMFRSMDDPLMSLFMYYPVVLGIILAWIWQKSKKLFTSKKKCKNGLYFGLIFLLLHLPNLIINYASFPIPFIMPFSWFLSLGIQGIVAGILFSKVLKA